ncbi:MAG: helix-turn-helix domain-containing protein [Gemmatimonadaceae bacterium]
METRSVCELAGLKISTLDYWVRTQLVVPSVRDGTGHRITRLWSVQDAVVVRTIKALRDAGCPLQSLRRVKQHLEDHWNETVAENVLVWTGDDLQTIDRWGNLRSLWRKPDQLTFHLVAMPVAKWRAETEAVYATSA